MYHPHNLLPCLHCHPHHYIRMVQYLIERCLILNMSRDQCINALAHHASIQPLITLTVWRELLKENKDFFRAYFHSSSPSCRPPSLISRRRHFQYHKAPWSARRKH
ncbi:uncharacterized protein LOC131145209 [Malania oleifera]|uniref:uncharacterized protein LOC131145209 n=1 Tax=Malania oleifera TaxID=397392 RepID=UPI0025ADBC91|nr:uncharacterized protein LOC131145209 [Malania oleifera]